jgi:SAM-dependent methyltransferase
MYPLYRRQKRRGNKYKEILMPKTEFYEIAVEHGFYGLEKSGLFGKKDNVRKYWEDISIKLSVRPAVEALLSHKNQIRVVDLGCGSGEGYELLTHIPPSNPVQSVSEEFLLSEKQIACYQGIDISPAMVDQGKRNYAERPNIHFFEADLSKGFPLMDDLPYDIYFSSYCSLSHLTCEELRKLTETVCRHITDTGYLVFDLHGRYSPEWPRHWDADCRKKLPYTMAYLFPPEKQDPEKIDWFNVAYWSPDELQEVITTASVSSGRNVEIMAMRDRSIFVGRHMETRLFKDERHTLRYQVNRLFDRDYRGDTDELSVDLSYLGAKKSSHPRIMERLDAYARSWEIVIATVRALKTGDNEEVKRLIESSEESLVEDLKMLAWIYRNAERFPVTDFWASVMGPQVACVLRNLELSLSPALGCGHSLFCLVKISQPRA